MATRLRIVLWAASAAVGIASMAILAAHDAATAATAATAVDPGDADHDRALVDRDANLHAVRRGRRTGSARRRLLGS